MKRFTHLLAAKLGLVVALAGSALSTHAATPDGPYIDEETALYAAKLEVRKTAIAHGDQLKEWGRCQSASDPALTVVVGRTAAGAYAVASYRKEANGYTVQGYPKTNISAVIGCKDQ